MGCDGGSIARRDDLVKQPKKKEILNQSDLDESRWFCCTLLQDPLSDPIVMDDYGNLFNKTNILQALLDGLLSQHDALSHIRSTKSVYAVHFIDNPAFIEQQQSNTQSTVTNSLAGNGSKAHSQWYCPITQTEVGGHQQRFSALRTCGHVFSEKAFKEIDSTICFVCSKPFETTDIIVLNPTPEELVDIKNRVQSNKKSSSSKKSKKSKKSKESKESKDVDAPTTTTSTTSTTSTSTTSTTSSPSSTKKRQTPEQSGESSFTSSFTRTALEQAKELTNKKMKSDTFSSIFAKVKSVNQ
ncbi:hypothetical protein SAMD00019534_013440 [Acytostelium subglobosum LB1]|uniref:hypothetical protein n=1 Tax=Acytostelium subglobosum LB1 TaxID=1410327 RepID=UPI000644A62D|nr:hypothetical protein SAMD00019534_013440 [Acytostelium subglobosum LB1]GAM18169.1 hypothetical protein SAMD00019534_013440 [Acytostelium subglobosum LB1]|eukprot:XP_012758765.1 hypothetical protein SAMD00019534_013440 [Acytostelium subglobosum LB1]